MYRKNHYLCNINLKTEIMKKEKFKRGDRIPFGYVLWYQVGRAVCP